MVKSKTPVRTVQPPSITYNQGLKLLNNDLSEGEALLRSSALESDNYISWCHITEQHLKDTFGSDHDTVRFFQNRGRGVVRMVVTGYSRPSSEIIEERRENLKSKIGALHTAIKQVEERIQLETETVMTPAPAQENAHGSCVFIVHGHNDGLKESVARLVGQLGLEPIILHEKPNKSRTLIEKFEDHAIGAGFAVVLLTGDDLGRDAKEPHDKDQLRARQNVILELGYFIGKIGRSRVCALYEEGVEIPTDFDGVTYIPVDTRGKWKHDLGFEIREAGYNVSLDEIR